MRTAAAVAMLAASLSAFATPEPQAAAPAAEKAAPQAEQQVAPQPPAATAPAPTQAAPTQPTPAAPAQVPAYTAPAGASPAGSLLQTIFALIAVLALLGGLAWFMKRYGPKAAGNSAAHLRIVASLNLGGRERIMVVEVGDQWIVVGASPGRVNALATMPKQEGVEPSTVLAAHLPSASSFSDWLKQTIDKRNAK